MKKLWVLLFLAFHFALPAQEKARIGMSTRALKTLYPGIITITANKDTIISRPATVYGLKNEWGYRFEEGKLIRIFFHYHNDTITRSNFKKCLTATQLLIKEYTSLYRKPDTLITGNTCFIDPYKKKHWGYDVLEARWKDYNGMKVKVEFTFMGGKGQYSFLVTVNYFDKNYPYYD